MTVTSRLTTTKGDSCKVARFAVGDSRCGIICGMKAVVKFIKYLVFTFCGAGLLIGAFAWYLSCSVIPDALDSCARWSPLDDDDVIIHAKDLSHRELHRRTKGLIPEEARDIEYSDTNLGHDEKYKCKVDKESLMRFARKRGFKFSPKADEKNKMMIECMFREEPECNEPCLSYTDAHWCGSGTYYRYDVQRGVLYYAKVYR